MAADQQISATASRPILRYHQKRPGSGTGPSTRCPPRRAQHNHNAHSGLIYAKAV